MIDNRRLDGAFILKAGGEQESVRFSNTKRIGEIIFENMRISTEKYNNQLSLEAASIASDEHIEKQN